MLSGTDVNPNTFLSTSLLTFKLTVSCENLNKGLTLVRKTNY